MKIGPYELLFVFLVKTGNRVCVEGLLTCSDGSGCYHQSQWCDGNPDCEDGADEDDFDCSSESIRVMPPCCCCHLPLLL